MVIESGLKVYQLIEELKKVDQELKIVVDGYEGGTNPLDRDNIRVCYVDTSAGSDWFGLYGNAVNEPKGMETPMLAILLGRS